MDAQPGHCLLATNRLEHRVILMHVCDVVFGGTQKLTQSQRPKPIWQQMAVGFVPTGVAYLRTVPNRWVYST